MQINTINTYLQKNVRFLCTSSGKDEFYYVESGTHKVTSIRKVDGGVEIEGTFDLVMEDNYGDIKKNVKGKYRITTEAYYTEGEY